MTKYLLGVDIGGTTSKIGIIKNDGTLIHKWEIKTRTGEYAHQIPNDIWLSIEKKLNEHHILLTECIGLGVGAPGFVISDTGEVAKAVNLGWENFPLGEQLHELSTLPVFVENDANIAALGENWLGSGALAENLIMVTLGTGVGGGIITNGKIISGVNGTAGEIGHMTVDQHGILCNCGRIGCLETIASATGIARMATLKAKQMPTSQLAGVLAAKNHLTAKDVFDLCEKNDVAAKEVVNEVTDVLGQAISNMATIINPSKIVIGGGVSKADHLLLVPLAAAFKRYALERTALGCTFEIAKLGNDAGMIGGAYLVKQHLS